MTADPPNNGEGNADLALLTRAREALKHAYAPYSQFRVGSAVQTADGTVFTGANVENASYGLTVCAERNAIFQAVCQGHTRIARLALSTEQAPTVPAEGMPCGACRQVMAEFMAQDAVVDVDHVGRFTVRELMPNAFVLD